MAGYFQDKPHIFMPFSSFLGYSRSHSTVSSVRLLSKILSIEKQDNSMTISTMWYDTFITFFLNILQIVINSTTLIHDLSVL